MADKHTTQTQSLENLLAYASQEIELADLMECIRATRADDDEEEDDGDTTNPTHGDPGPIEGLSL